MEKIVFNHNVYRIPTSWQDVTVDMLIKANDLSEVIETAPLIVILSTYSGIPIKELGKAKTNEVEDVMNMMSFIQKPYVPEPRIEFEFNGNVYKCKDDLTEQNFEDYVSVQTTLYNHRDNPVHALPYLIAIMCKREGEGLDDFSLQERAKEFRQLPCTTAKDIEGFFLHLINSYSSVIQLSSAPARELQKELVLNKLSELKSTMKAYRGQTGIFSPTRLLIGILLIYLRYVKVVLVRYFNSKPSKS